MGDKPGSPDNTGQLLPPTNPFSVLNVLRALAQVGIDGPAGGALAAGDLADRVARAQSQQRGAPQTPQPSQNSQSDSSGSIVDRLADKLYGPVSPPAPPPPPGPPPMKGVNPVTGETLFSPNPKGEAGHERPGAGGAGNFGARRSSPGHWRLHQGEDISGPLGTNIHAATDGTVTFSGLSGTDTTGYGNLVVIDNGDGTVTRYAHNRENLVEVGDRVRQGDVIATLGQTGNAADLDPSEAHVHFEVEENGRRVDPATWLNSAIASSAKASSRKSPAPAAPRKQGAKQTAAPGKKK